jgi:signal transduction histidine kinase
MRDPYDEGKVKYLGLARMEELGWFVMVEKGRSEILKELSGIFGLIGGVSLLLGGIFMSVVIYFVKKQDYLAELRFLYSRILTAQEEERKRIAREIHDSISSSLSAVKYGLESHLKKIRKDAPLESLITATRIAIEESRRIMADLRPGILDDLGIIATISWVCREFEKIYSAIQIRKEIEVEEEEMPEPLKIVIFRILQEALNNIAKYSKANLVLVSLKKNGRRLELTIEDNGIGFNMEEMLARERSKKGLGLESMRERAEYTSGSFDIESGHGRGTTVRASWPLS